VEESRGATSGIMCGKSFETAGFTTGRSFIAIDLEMTRKRCRQEPIDRRMMLCGIWKKIAADSASFVLLAIIGAVEYRSLASLTDTSHLVTHTHEVPGAHAEVLSFLKDAETGQRDTWSQGRSLPRTLSRSN